MDAGEDTKAAAKLALILWHGLTHKKKLHLKQNKANFQTPDRLNTLFKREDPDTSGRAMEKHYFMHEVFFEDLKFKKN